MAAIILKLPIRINNADENVWILGEAAFILLITPSYEFATSMESKSIMAPIVSEKIRKATSADSISPMEIAYVINPAKMGPVQPIPAAV